MSLFYYSFGDIVRVYVDLVLLINFIFDFILLISVSYVLKRNTSLKRILFGAATGSLSILFLFFNLSNFMLFLYKLLLSMIMILSSFGFKNIKYFTTNIFYLYLSSIVLGGGLYLLNDHLNYSINGLTFVNNNYKLNIVLSIIITPVLIFLYVRQIKNLKYNYNNYYDVELFYENKKYFFTAYLDTGNKLKDQYKKRPIILVNTDKIVFSYEKGILVPYSTIDRNGILKCIIADKIIINKEKELFNVLIGLSEEKFHIDGVNMLLNNETL